MLAEAESEQKYDVFSEERFAVVASRIGNDDQRILSGKVRSLLNIEFGLGPHSVIVTGPLHFTESEALSSLTQCLDAPADNASRIMRISSRMVNQYAPKARRAVQQMREFVTTDAHSQQEPGGMIEVLDNAECYISDAERFLKQGKFELAVLSIGYAEGLVDALRFQKGINPWEQLS
jgi:diphthine synthase